MTVNLDELTGTWDRDRLPKNIRIGADCYLENPNCFHRFRSGRDPGLVLGDRVRIYSWTSFGVEQSGLVTIGSDSVLVGVSIWCAERITLGERVVCSHFVIITDSDFHPRDPVLRRADAIAVSPYGDPAQRPALHGQPVTIEDDVEIGIGAIVLKGVHIGAGARVGAGSVVTSDVPAGVTIVGNPARIYTPDSASQ